MPQQPQNPGVQPNTPQQPQQPQIDPSRAQPGQGDDFTQPGKSNEQANAGRPSDDPVEPQQNAPEDDEDIELEEESDNDDATIN